jgi:hypothetical protein
VDWVLGNHGCDGKLFYLGLALIPPTGRVAWRGSARRNPDEEQLFRDLWEDEGGIAVNSA